jgi:hypothetical protein
MFLFFEKKLKGNFFSRRGALISGLAFFGMKDRKKI